MMFELEDFDLDDEIFLNTQMPTETSNSLIISSNSSCFNSKYEDNLETFPDLTNSVNELETLHTKKNKCKYKPIEKENKNISNLHNIKVTHNSCIMEYNSKIKTTNDIQSDKFILNFDDGFDSDDEAFFNTPEIFHESTNSLKTKNSMLNTQLDKSYESFSNVHSDNQKSILKLLNSKNDLKSNNESHVNSTVASITTISPKFVSRKFPGPAGLLSENEHIYSEDTSNLESLDMSLSINISENDKKEENLNTQENDSSFFSSPYQQFLSDFITTNIDMLLDKFNVAWIKQKLLPYTASGRFFTDKIPFFVSIIKEIDCLSPDPTVLLADKTGNIRGTIHRAVWNQFSSQLKLGSVLILSKVGVSCQKIVKSFTLNITSDHLIAIYSFSSENVQEVIVTRTTNLTNEEIINDAKCLNVFNMETLIETPYSEIRSRMTALNNLKFHNILVDENCQLSNANTQAVNNSTIQSTPIKNLFKPKTSIAHNLLKKYNVEEPPAKRIKNKECELKAAKLDSNNEMSIIQNIFEGIDKDEMFNDFCC